MSEHEELLEKFQREIEYAEAHREELLNQYPEQWVAILDQQVVGVKPDIYQLTEDLNAKGILIDQVLIKHLTQQQELFIL
jgi:hypothetical protein